MGKASLRILHFNDVYNLEESSSSREPVGGAARFATKVKSFSPDAPLILFGGDAFNPSLMSTITKGRQMVDVLNALGVTAAVMGNHDLDFGLENFVALARDCRFPWLCSNLLNRSTGEPLGDTLRSKLLDWHGVKVGLIGLVEEEWIASLSVVDENAVQYVDFIAEGRRLAKKLRDEGAEVVVALTHMRVPNDLRLAAEVPELDLVLGGHDHHYQVEFVPPSNVLLCKSGTEFRELTEVRIEISEGKERPKLEWTRHPITRDVPPDPAMADIVNEYSSKLGSRMEEVSCRFLLRDGQGGHRQSYVALLWGWYQLCLEWNGKGCGCGAQEIGETYTDLDGRFKVVRTQESNLGNFVCDVWRTAARAEIALLNSGTLRSDMIHTAGVLRVKDVISILPMLDETTVLELEGEAVLACLENGVSQWPKLEGRFLQVSGLRFQFDPEQAAGGRVVEGSVVVGKEPLDLKRRYSVVVKDYMAEGKEGFDVLKGAKVLVDPEVAPLLPTLLRNLFTELAVLNRWHGKENTVLRAVAKLKSSVHGSCERHVCDTDGRESSLAVRHPGTGRYVVGPKLEGRIVNVRTASSELRA